MITKTIVLVTPTGVINEMTKDLKQKRFHYILLDKGFDIHGRWRIEALIEDKTSNVTIRKWRKNPLKIEKIGNDFIYPDFANHEDWTLEQDNEFIETLHGIANLFKDLDKK